MHITTIEAFSLKALAAFPIALLLACAVSCGGPKKQADSEVAQPTQSWQFFATKADFPACDAKTHDQLFYDAAAKVLYVCHAEGDGFALDEAELNDLKGDKGKTGDKGEPGSKGPKGPKGG